MGDGRGGAKKGGVGWPFEPQGFVEEKARTRPPPPPPPPPPLPTHPYRRNGRRRHAATAVTATATTDNGGGPRPPVRHRVRTGRSRRPAQPQSLVAVVGRRWPASPLAALRAGRSEEPPRAISLAGPRPTSGTTWIVESSAITPTLNVLWPVRHSTRRSVLHVGQETTVCFHAYLNALIFTGRPNFDRPDHQKVS